MDMTFIGHNAMYFGGDDGLLVDPVLEKTYGDDYTSSPVEIYPPRQVLFDEMPRPSAIVVSHEHSDHFQVASLNRLDRSATVYVGPLMPQPIRTLLSNLGFEVIVAKFGQEYSAGDDVLFQLYPAGNNTALWESRVSQIYVRDAVTPDLGGIFVTVDALPSERFIQDVRAGIVPAPSVYGCSNNAQVTPPGVYGSTDNMVDEHTFAGVGQRSAIPGVEILAALFDDSLTPFPELLDADLLITGGGFLKDYEQMGPFPLSDQKVMAAALQRLCENTMAFGPSPGDRFEFKSGRLKQTDADATWVRLDTRRWNELMQRRERFIQEDGRIPSKEISASLTTNEVADVLPVVEDGLAYLARLLLTTDYSAMLKRSSIDEGRAHDLFLFRLVNGGDRYEWALDLRLSRFIPVDDATADSDAVAHYPFGICTQLADWYNVLTGHLQIWDIVGVAMRSWYPSDYGRSPVFALYNGFGEQARPDIAFDIYKRQLARVLQADPIG
ncbi:hypothetical protein V1Y59_23575 [Gordonia sp. PKS22-38]|uniref:MBL fold metallo-hydrolase n=1 Tax=Gordonia prachuapensis TaxID=3115651 RepID=A0ABU7N0U6_9ACTN|nr:hypothetical protein [Gordonia sp. PKS22-38]